MLYENAVQIGATLLTILLPTVTAFFAFRSAERKIGVDKDKITSVISYEEPMMQLANSTTEIASCLKRQVDRDYEWQQAVLREMHSISEALRALR